MADNNQLRNAVASTTPGSAVSLEVLRNGHTETMHATVGELESKRDRRSTTESGRGDGKYGMGVEPLTPDTAEQLGISHGTKGVVVADVDPEGIAAESGIQEGDVIEKANGQPVSTTDALKSALDNANGKPTLLLINRKGSEAFLTLRAR